MTHDQEEALYLSDRIAVMRSGKIVQLASPEEIYLHPANEFVADFIGDVNFLDGTHDPLRQGVVLADGGFIEATLTQPAGPVRLVVRPENLALANTSEPALPGVITEVSHQTGTTLLGVRLAGGQELKVRQLGLAGVSARHGQPVRVRFTDCTLAFAR